MTDDEQQAKPAEEIVPVQEPAADMVVAEEPQTPSPETSPSGPTFGERVRKVLLFLLRLVMVLLILAAIAVGLSYGLPLLYQRYIEPVRDNTAQLEQLKTQVAEHQTAIAEFPVVIESIQTAQSRDAGTIATLEGKLQTIEGQIQEHTRALVDLEQMQKLAQEENQALNAELTHQISLMKSMELLSRARLFMYQSNFGLARQDVQTARDLLATVQPSAPADLADDLAAVIHRLDLTLSNLPAFPVAASDDLDIAWQILLAGLPEVQPPALTPTPVPVEVTVTPTAVSTPEPTATP